MSALGWSQWLASIVGLNRTLGAMPMVSADQAEVLTDYETSLRALTDAVQTATDWVHAESTSSRSARRASTFGGRDVG